MSDQQQILANINTHLSNQQKQQNASSPSPPSDETPSPYDEASGLMKKPGGTSGFSEFGVSSNNSNNNNMMAADIAATSDNVITRMLYRARVNLDHLEEDDDDVNLLSGGDDDDNESDTNNSDDDANNNEMNSDMLSSDNKNLLDGSDENVLKDEHAATGAAGEADPSSTTGDNKKDTSGELALDDLTQKLAAKRKKITQKRKRERAKKLAAESKEAASKNASSGDPNEPLRQDEAARIINQPYTIRIEGNDVEEEKGAVPLIEALLKREAYKGNGFDKGGNEPQAPLNDEQAALNKIEVVLVDGIYHFDGMETRPVPWKQYIADLNQLFGLLEVGAWLSLAKTRLTALEEKFELFSLLNADLEETFDTHFGGGGVFGRSVKVDNAVRLSTAATADVLVENIRVATRMRAAEVVHIDQDGEPMTFRDLTEELGIDATKVTAEGLGLHPPARKEASKRYDVLDPDMNAAGADGVELLSLFLEPHGTNNGRFFADLVRPILEKRETASAQSQAALNVAGEYKLPILGMRIDEWSAVARWITDNSFTQMTRATFSIEIPRIERKRPEYDCRTTEDQIRNIFYPMFMATLRPADPEYHSIAVALMKVSSICISSDEKLRRTNFSENVRPPSTIAWQITPDDYYFFYYIWANLCSLNALRRKFGLNTFQFRTICSEETPHWDQLVVSFLLADVVEQGGRLIHSWPFQYLYKIARIGMTMSPISSNGAGVSFFDSPFPRLFKRGLLVSLSTGDPLHFHHNSDPLIEEYGTAQSIFALSTADVSELARNSILVSNFPNEHKMAWLGPTYARGADGNDASKSHVSDVRLQFRHECLVQEQQTLNLAVANAKKRISFNWYEPSDNATSAGRRGQYLNPLVAKLREMQRMNSIDRRIPFSRIVIDGPAVDAKRVRSHANMLRGAITLRGRYQLHADPTLTQNLLKDGSDHSPQYTAGVEVKTPPQYTPNQQPVGHHHHHHSSSHHHHGPRSPTNNSKRQNNVSNSNNNNIGSRASPSLTRHNSVWFDGYNINTLSRHQSIGNFSALTNEDMFTSTNSLGDPLNDLPQAAASFRFGADDVGALERAFKISDSSFDPAQYAFNMYYGVALIHPVGTIPAWPEYIPTFEMFMQDVAYLRQLVTENSSLAEFCLQRLKLLQHKFGLHLALNISKEAGEVRDRELNNRDFYTAHKVDNNVQTEACMNARVLFHYFTERARNGSTDVVFERNNKPVSLHQYLNELGVEIDRLTVDELTNLLQTHKQLRDLFLSPDNYMGGRYFAEITKHMLEQYKNDKFSFVENRLPIYGRSRSEWDVLASWVDRYGMVSTQSRWMARISRGYRHLYRDGHVNNFGDYLDNIFIPLWEVSLNPAKYPRLHHFLTYVSGFDCEGNEQKVDMALENTPPHEWNSPLNPPYNYYVYYLWANITALNVFRRQRGLNVFSFRPQAGETGSLDHLIGTFLVADGISHGVQLIHSPTLQYLFYVTQFPIAMSPLSNTTVIPYLDHPFSHFFSRGLNVSLATNKPLFNHFTSEPLIEEYSLASKIWKLQNGDLSELAKNSVKMSDFGSQWKRKALGDLYSLHSALGNEYKLSRVADIRVAFRYETYQAELDYLDEVFAMEDPRMWINSIAAGQYGEDIEVKGNNNANANSPSQQQNDKNHHPQGLIRRGSSKMAQLLLGPASPEENNNNNNNNIKGALNSKDILDRAKSSRIPPEQLILATESQLMPFPRAMLPIELEVELYQQRTGTKVFLPSSFGDAGNEKEEEEIGRAQMLAYIKKQLADMDRELQIKKLEIDRMSETGYRVAGDIKTVTTKIKKMVATPTTNLDASLGQPQ